MALIKILQLSVMMLVNLMFFFMAYVGFMQKGRSTNWLGLQRILKKTRADIWPLYRALKAFRLKPNNSKKISLEKRFDNLFTQKTGFATLDLVLKRIHNNKKELLLVLDRPDIPLHNNLSERDIREYVKKRKISGSTRSDTGKTCRDTFTSLKKTCRKLGVSFWAYLKDRLKGEDPAIPYLPDLIRLRAQEQGI